MNPQPRTALGMGLGFIGVAAFSLSLPMTRLAVTAMEAGTVAVWRGLLAAAAATVILLLFYREWPSRAGIIPLLVAGAGIVIGFPVFATLAMQTIPASHGAIVIGLLPITTAALGVLTTSERPSPAFWLISALGTLAILIFIFRQSHGGFEIGHIYLLVAVFSAAIGYVFGGNAAKEIGGPRAICWALVLMIPFLAVAAFFVPPVPWQAPQTTIFAFLYLAFISQLAGFFAWYAGLAYGGVARVSQIQLLQIFMTLIASAILLSEPLSMEIWTFAGLVMICVVLITRLRIGSAGQ